MAVEKIKYLIIGGGIAGTTAAETIRRHDASGSIGIVSDEPHRLYSRVMLSKPNFFLERIPFEQIWLKKDSWYAENDVGLIAGRRAAGLDAFKKTVTLDDGTPLAYEKLLLAIGGGFVSFEMCEMLRMAGIAVTLILREPYYWQPLLDESSGRMIERALENGGVKILYAAEVSRVLGGSAVTGVALTNGAEIPCEMIIAGIGIFCPLEWIAHAGVAVNRGILANEYLETNQPDVWAAGDAAEFNDLILGERLQLGNWVNAQVQGRAAGANMAGQRQPFRMVSFYTTQGFGITIAFVGDVRPEKDRMIIPRGTPENGSYGRIIIKDGEVIGATLINRTAELAAISKMIEKDVKVAGREKELADTSFDLKTLLS